MEKGWGQEREVVPLVHIELLQKTPTAFSAKLQWKGREITLPFHLSFSGSLQAKGALFSSCWAFQAGSSKVWLALLAKAQLAEEKVQLLSSKENGGGKESHFLSKEQDFW